MRKILMMFKIAGVLAVMAFVGACGGGGGDGPLPPGPNEVTVNAANLAPGYDASGVTGGSDRYYFLVHPTSSFTYIVDRFATGDRLVFDAGTALELINANGADGLLDVVGTKDGRTATLHLTGISPASDAALLAGASFNAINVFGAGALSPTDAANVPVSAAGAYDAFPAAVKFFVHPTATFTYNLANFAAGDRLVFDEGTALELINANGADGLLDVIGRLNGQAATIHLTGIAPALDAALVAGSSFNAVFGAGALSPTDAANVPVSAAGAYDASLAAVKFFVHPTTTFTYNLANFAAGDRLVFDSGAAISLINVSGADGVLDVVGSLNGQAATVHLTGIAPASDAALVAGNTFNTVFGAGVLSPTDAANVHVAAANAAPGYDASPAAVRFFVHPTTTFTYNLVSFAAGDKLVFDDGTAVGLTNLSGTDGVIEIVGTKNGQAATLRLTGIALESDGQIIGINSFNAVFGLGSLVGANGDVIVQPAEVSVAAANTAPGYDASTAAIVFNIHPTATFIYNIVGFADGDKLVFDGGTAVGLTNTSGADGVIVVQGSLNGQVATVRLSGIAPASDSAIFGVNSFNTEFGPGSLGTLQ